MSSGDRGLDTRNSRPKAERISDDKAVRIGLLRFASEVLEVVRKFGGNQSTFPLALARNMGLSDASTFLDDIAECQEVIRGLC